MWFYALQNPVTAAAELVGLPFSFWLLILKQLKKLQSVTTFFLFQFSQIVRITDFFQE
jgi:hypothetical protein